MKENKQTISDRMGFFFQDLYSIYKKKKVEEKKGNKHFFSGRTLHNNNNFFVFNSLQRLLMGDK